VIKVCKLKEKKKVGHCFCCQVAPMIAILCQFYPYVVHHLALYCWVSEHWSKNVRQFQGLPFYSCACREK